MVKIKDIAQVVKTKNAGPYQLTIDIIFEDHAIYEKVLQSGVLTPELFADLYNTDPQSVIFTAYGAANAIKATVPRRIVAGDPGDSDVYGAQQHFPVLGIEVPI